jgi:Protein of unknown function (DUF2939)
MGSEMKKWSYVGAVLILILFGIYFGSPYYAIYSLRNAAIEGDKDKLEERVDFPAVRDSLKSQMSAAMMKKMQDDPEMQNNPFAGLGTLMMPAIVDRMVDSFVTPDGIAAMVQGQKPNDKSEAQSNPEIESRTEFVNFDRFRVRLSNSKLNEVSPSFLLERRGFATWKLIKVEIPDNLLVEKK